MKLTDSSAAKTGASNVLTVSTFNGAKHLFHTYSDTLVSRDITGSTSFVKDGAGTLTLSGANTYSNNSQILNGIASITTTGALPGFSTNGRYSVASTATLAVYNAVTDANVVSILGTNNFAAGSFIGFDTTSGNRTYPNAITNTSQGMLGLVKLGSNTLTISSNVNNYTGATKVLAGTLATSAGNRIPDSSAVEISSGATVTLGGSEVIASLAGAGTMTCGGNTLTIGGSNTTNFSGSLTNTQTTGNSLFKTGTGSQTFSGTASIGAGIQFQNGTVGLTGTFTQTLAGGAPRNTQLAVSAANTFTLNSSGSTTFTGLMFGENSGGTSTVNVTAGTFTVSGETWMSGVLSTLNLSGGTFSGATCDIGGGGGTTTSVINQTGGLFTCSNFIRFGIGGAAATSVYNLDGGTFRVGNFLRNGGTNTFNFNGGTYTIAATASLNPMQVTFNVKPGGAIFSIPSGMQLTFDNVLVGLDGGGGLTKNDTGTLSLTQANTYTGATVINSGTLLLGNNTTTGTIANSSTITNNATLTFSRSNTITQGTDFPAITGTGTVIQAGSGTTILSSDNSYSGETRINAGTVRLGHANGFGSGNVRSSGGGMQYATGITADVSSKIKNSGSTIVIDTNGNNVTFASAIDSTNSGGLTKNGTGTLTLSANNTYTGNTSIGGGTLTVAGQLASGAYSSNISMTGGFTYDSANNQALSGVLSGAGQFTKNGTGSLTLSGASNTMSGTFSIGVTDALTTGGTVILNNNSSLGTKSVQFESDGTVVFNANNITVSNSIAVYNRSSTGSRTIQYNLAGTNSATFSGLLDIRKADVTVIDVGASNTLTISGNIQSGAGAGGFSKTGTGTLVLTGTTNNYNGTTVISAGVLQVGANGTSGSLTTNNNAVTNNASLIFRRTDTLVTANPISGTGTITQAGSGTIVLSGNSSYTGNTLINAGNLRLGHASGFGATSEIRFNGGVMSYAAGITADISASIKNNSQSVRIDTNGQTVSFASLGSTNTGGLTKSGSGTLTLAGSGNTYTGITNVSSGELVYAGSYTATNAVNVAGTTPIITITGTFTQTYTGSGVRSFQIAINSGTSATANISGSANVTLNGGMMLGDNGGGNGTMNVSGGTVSVPNGTWLAGASCLLNVSGGTFTTVGIECGGGTGAGILTVSGTGTINSGSLILCRGSGAGVSATVNINSGGTLTTTGATHVTTTRPATLNFDGGTLSLLNTLSIPSTITLVVKSGGAIFNVSSGTTTVPGSLTDGTGGGGLTKQGTGLLTLSGSTLYTGTTSITAGTLRRSFASGSLTYAEFTNTTLTASFNTTPTNGATYQIFTGATTQSYASVTVSGVSGVVCSYNSSTSTLTVVSGGV